MKLAATDPAWVCVLFTITYNLSMGFMGAHQQWLVFLNKEELRQTKKEKNDRKRKEKVEETLREEVHLQQ